MSPLALAATLLFGAVVGLVSGLVGVGGGIVMVPLLYLLLAHPEWSGIVVPADQQAVVAHATSLLVIVPTALAGIWTYQRSGSVVWRVALPMALVAVVAATLGVQVAVRVPSGVLKAAFGLFLLASGINLLRASPPEGGISQPPRAKGVVVVAGGVLIGLVTSLLGVGGGIVAIPTLIYLIRMDMRKVAATSLGIAVFSALAAAATYAVSGWGHPDLPGGSWGYVYLPAGLALMPGAVLTARWGARLNQRMNPRGLKVLFGLFFMLIGLRLFLGNLGIAPS